MKSLIKFSLLILFGSISCLPDRTPTDPIENARPEFAAFDTSLNQSINTSLRPDIKMFFNEAMDLNSFTENFILQSISGPIDGVFSEDPAADSIVIFTPLSDLNEAELYHATISAYVRDANGNSILLPSEPDEPQSIWFFTKGPYSENGTPYVLMRDKTDFSSIYQIHDINVFSESLTWENARDDLGTAELESDPEGNNLYMVNLKVAGTVTVINMPGFGLNTIIPVGAGPTAIAFSATQAFVTNNTGRSLSVIDRSSMQAVNTIEFADGFKPQDVVYSSSSNKCYMYSKTNGFLLQIKVLDAANPANVYDIEDVFENKVIDINISPDGQKLVFIEDKSSRIYFVDVQNETASFIETGYSNNIVSTISADYCFVAFKETGSDGPGGIVKVSLTSQSVEDVFIFEPIRDTQVTIADIDITHSGELIYAVVAQDTTVKLVETSTMTQISQSKLTGSPRTVTVTPKNF